MWSLRPARLDLVGDHAHEGYDREDLFGEAQSATDRILGRQGLAEPERRFAAYRAVSQPSDGDQAAGVPGGLSGPGRAGQGGISTTR